jgi:prespore-specific regulator
MSLENQERKDSWQPDQDTLLAETVLEYIRNNKTQLEAFETVASFLNRTTAACGFRWNSDVRKRYNEQIKQAKQERIITSKIKNSHALIHASIDTVKLADLSEVDPLDVIVENILNYRTTVFNMKRQIKSLSTELHKINSELEKSNSRIIELEQENEQLRNANPQAILSEDAQTLIKILQRARDLGAINR